MSERRKPVFVVATANDITRLPPEMVRKGRFDEIFFVDLPSPQSRRSILEIHLGKRLLDPKRFGLDALAKATEGFSGSEIEQAIISAMYTAHAQGREISQEDLLEEIQQTRPLSVVMAEPKGQGGAAGVFSPAGRGRDAKAACASLYRHRPRAGKGKRPAQRAAYCPPDSRAMRRRSRSGLTTTG